MPIVSPESLYTALRHGNIAPVYFLFGDEEFLIDEALDTLIKATVDDSTRSFNFDQFQGAETTLQELAERASAYPMMTERRVVVMRDVDKAIGSRKVDAVGPLKTYLARPSETTVLILTAATSTFLGKAKGKPKAPYDAIIETATAVQFKKVYDRELPSWVNSRVEKGGKRIAPDAVELFVGYVGSSLRTLSNEIEKLFTYVEDRRSISIDDVRMVVGASKTFNVFELQKAIGEKRLEESAEIVGRMLAAGEAPQLILTMLSRYFTILWRLAELRAKQTDQKTMAREVGISPFFINEYLAALNRYSLTDIRHAFEALLAADISLKTSPAPESIVMSMLVVSIIQGTNLLDPAVVGSVS